MFISQLECPESRGNHPLTYKCKFKTQNSINWVTSFSLKPVLVALLSPLFLADLDKKYTNKIEMDKK